MEDRIRQLESEIEAIKQRNTRVEADKAWETSFVRIVTICGITYVVAAAVLWSIGSDRFWLGAIMPVVGFFLSSQSLPEIKRRWIEQRYKQEQVRGE